VLCFYRIGVPIHAVEPLEIMGIVNRPLVNFTRCPTEGGVTVGAPHLITTVNLVNQGRAFWTRLCGSLDHLHRFDVARVTLVTIAILTVTSLTNTYIT
jgi:hypothetical protein